MDDALPLPLALRHVAPALSDRAAPAPRPRGPVLMGDLVGQVGGRPLLLWHWDRDPDG
jgi:hypothetical protein